MIGAGQGRPGTIWRYHFLVQTGRLVLGLLPTGALWGLDSIRYVPPLFAAGALSLGVASVIPRACAALEVTARGALGRLPGNVLVILSATAPALLAWCLPDRTVFAGDSLQRLGVVASGTLVEAFPQTMPLDALLNQSIARRIAEVLSLSLFDANRVLGTIVVFAAGVAAAALARSSEAGGHRHLLVPLTTGLSGLLFACTGSGRADAMVALLSVAFVGLAYRDLKSPSRWAGAEAVFVLGLFVHRAMLMMLPLLLLLLVRHFVRRPAEAASSGLGGRRWAAIGLGLVALTGVPRYWQVLTSFDAVHHLAPAGWTPGLVWAVVAPRQLLDVANTVLLVAPAAPLLCVTACAGLRSPRRPLLLATWFSVLPWVLALLFAHPQQGLFRDFGVFAPFGALCGFLFGVHVVGDGGGAWDRRLGVGAALAFASVMLAPLALWATPASSHGRLLAFASDTLGQSPARRADVWAFLSGKYEQESRPREAFEAAARAYGLQSTPRLRAQCLLAGARASQYGEVRRVAAQAIRGHLGGTLEWLALTGAASALADSTTLLRGEGVLRKLAKSASHRAIMRDALGLCPELWPRIPPTTLRALTAPSDS